jgi:hypothetical protein
MLNKRPNGSPPHLPKHVPRAVEKAGLKMSDIGTSLS